MYSSIRRYRVAQAHLYIAALTVDYKVGGPNGQQIRAWARSSNAIDVEYSLVESKAIILGIPE